MSAVCKRMVTCASVNDNIKQEAGTARCLARIPLDVRKKNSGCLFLIVLTTQNFVLVCAHYSRNFFTKSHRVNKELQVWQRKKGGQISWVSHLRLSNSPTTQPLWLLPPVLPLFWGRSGCEPLFCSHQLLDEAFPLMMTGLDNDLLYIAKYH